MGEFKVGVKFCHLHTKLTKWHVHPAKTLMSLDIRPVWSASSLSAWRKLGSLATHWAHSKDSESLHWAHTHFIGFVMRWLLYLIVWVRKQVFIVGFVDSFSQTWSFMVASLRLNFFFVLHKSFFFFFVLFYTKGHKDILQTFDEKLWSFKVHARRRQWVSLQSSPIFQNMASDQNLQFVLNIENKNL